MNRPQDAATTDRTPRVTAKGAIVAFIVGGFLAIAVAETAIRLLMPDWRSFSSARFITRAVGVPLGWAIGKPGFDGTFAQNDGDFKVRIRINEFGLRNGEPVSAADGRVWIVGDSMAFGWGVERDRIYTAVAHRISGMPTYNVASPGTDIIGYQRLVRRMPKSLTPRAVVVGLILENDLADYAARRAARRRAGGRSPDRGAAGSWFESVSWIGIKYRLTEASALYNFVAIAVKRSEWSRQLLIRFGIIARAHSYEEFLETLDIATFVPSSADELLRLKAMLPAKTPFAVLVAPTRFEIRDRNPESIRMRNALSAALAARGIAVIDPIDGFLEAGFRATHFRHDGHWSPRGHDIAGRAVAKWLGAIFRPVDRQGTVKMGAGAGGGG